MLGIGGEGNLRKILVGSLYFMEVDNFRNEDLNWNITRLVSAKQIVRISSAIARFSVFGASNYNGHL